MKLLVILIIRVFTKCIFNLPTIGLQVSYKPDVNDTKENKFPEKDAMAEWQILENYL